MKTMLGVAAIILMGAPIAHASVRDAKEASELTTKKQTITPHQITIAAADRSRCTRGMIALLPFCNN